MTIIYRYFFVSFTASVSLAVRAVSDLTKPMEYLLATGNLASKTGLGLMQVPVNRYQIILNFVRVVSTFHESKYTNLSKFGVRVQATCLCEYKGFAVKYLNQ